MSYFGNSGPAQDGGFLGGIERGANRLHNARVTRARYSKSINGPVSRLMRDLTPDSSYPDPEILNTRAENFIQSYDAYVTTKEAEAQGRTTAAYVDAAAERYQADRDAIVEWAEAGPYVREGKAMALSGTAVITAIAAVYLFTRVRIPILRPVRPRQSPMYAIWS
jgi:hypothetical protein